MEILLVSVDSNDRVLFTEPDSSGLVMVGGFSGQNQKISGKHFTGIRLAYLESDCQLKNQCKKECLFPRERNFHRLFRSLVRIQVGYDSAGWGRSWGVVKPAEKHRAGAVSESAEPIWVLGIVLTEDESDRSVGIGLSLAIVDIHLAIRMTLEPPITDLKTPVATRIP